MYAQITCNICGGNICRHGLKRHQNTKKCKSSIKPDDCNNLMKMDWKDIYRHRNVLLYRDELKIIPLYYFCVVLGLLNFILKEWCTISRGAEPHAQKANDEKVLKKVAHTYGLSRAERSDGPRETISVYYLYIYSNSINYTMLCYDMI